MASCTVTHIVLLTAKDGTTAAQKAALCEGVRTVLPAKVPTVQTLSAGVQVSEHFWLRDSLSHTNSIVDGERMVVEAWGSLRAS
jgi:hypothetical protein